MTVTPASLTALEASARKRSADVEARIDRALKKMRKQGLDINVSSLARHAGVSRSVIHRRPQLREQIRTTQPAGRRPRSTATTGYRHREQHHHRATDPPEGTRRPDRRPESPTARTRPHHRDPARATGRQTPPGHQLLAGWLCGSLRGLRGDEVVDDAGAVVVADGA